MNFGLVYPIKISHNMLIETFHLAMSLVHTELDIDLSCSDEFYLFIYFFFLTRLGEDPRAD